MKTLIVLILSAWWGMAAAASPELSSVKKVYLFPMTGGLEQYLAGRLTADAVFQVVVDPKQADAVWTDRVDAAFNAQLDELYPPAKAAETKGKPASEGDISGMKEPPPRRSSGRGRGNLFLVGVGSRRVIWSHYQKVEDTSPGTLHRWARDIVKRLQKDLSGKE